MKKLTLLALGAVVLFGLPVPEHVHSTPPGEGESVASSKLDSLLDVVATPKAFAASPFVWTEAQNLSRAIPLDTDQTAGINLSRSDSHADLASYRITICPPSGQTITGGSIKVLWYSYDRSVWSSNRDLTISLDPASPTPCQTYADLTVGPSYGRLLPIASGVTLSGAGTQVTITVTAYSR